jgi:hypothetical protein
MKEEDVVKKVLGKENPFKVPEGYFDNFTSQMMDSLPEKEFVEDERPTRWTIMKPWVYMAAAFIGAVLMIRAISWLQTSRSDKMQAPANTTEIAQDRYVNEVVKDSRLDDYQLYQLLSDAGNDQSK